MKPLPNVWSVVDESVIEFQPLHKHLSVESSWIVLIGMQQHNWLDPMIAAPADKQNNKSNPIETHVIDQLLHIEDRLNWDRVTDRNYSLV